jgi:D-glycerate 3-kinase
MTSSLNADPPSKPPPTSLLKTLDDKSTHCIPFILSRLSLHRASARSAPFFIGLNGVQGAGKTTLVSALATTLQSAGHETLVCSIDDLYLPHDEQVKLAQDHALNPLVQHRGEPGTHDMLLAAQLFEALKEGRETKIPQYDKSLHSGAGDRVPSSQWATVNTPSQPSIRVIILEGWCVGFRSLPPSQIALKQAAPSKTLQNHRLEDLLFVNEKLRGYDIMTDAFDAFIHIDAEETGFVYEWRLEQEAALRKEKGSGMSNEMVREFVDGYFPAYELFTEGVREGVLRDKGQGRQLRLIVGRDRKVKQVTTV